MIQRIQKDSKQLYSDFVTIWLAHTMIALEYPHILSLAQGLVIYKSY
jgi:hypothetical protein